MRTTEKKSGLGGMLLSKFQGNRRDWGMEAPDEGGGRCHQRSCIKCPANSDADQKSLGVKLKKHVGLGMSVSVWF